MCSILLTCLPSSKSLSKVKMTFSAVLDLKHHILYMYVVMYQDNAKLTAPHLPNLLVQKLSQ